MTPQNSPMPWSSSELQTTSELSFKRSNTLAETPLNEWTPSDEAVFSTPPKSAACRQFQEKLKKSNNNFGAALTEIFSDLVELKIVTWVAHEGETEQAGNRLKTTINLIDGDIENEIGADFLQGNPYFELRSFHEKQCANGAVIIKDNLNVLVEMGEKVAALLDRKKEPNL